METTEAFVKSLSCSRNISLKAAPWIVASPVIYLLGYSSFGVMSAFVGSYIALSSIIYQLSTEILLTTHRISYKTGVANRIDQTINISDIRESSVRKSFISSKFGMADVLIKVTKGRDFRIRHLSLLDAQQLDKRIQTARAITQESANS